MKQIMCVRIVVSERLLSLQTPMGKRRVKNMHVCLYILKIGMERGGRRDKNNKKRNLLILNYVMFISSFYFNNRRVVNS